MPLGTETTSVRAIISVWCLSGLIVTYDFYSLEKFSAEQYCWFNHNRDHKAKLLFNYQTEAKCLFGNKIQNSFDSLKKMKRKT